MRLRQVGWVFFCICGLLGLGQAQGESFRIVTYNLESYLDVPTETRRAKEPEAKAKVVQSILAVKPDVLVLQEMGTTNALIELKAALARAGLELPFWEHVSGSDTNIHQAVLSRFPFASRRSHVNESYLLSGRRFWPSRGFVDLDIQVNPQYQFTLLGAHLKSRLSSYLADESEMREQEALILRRIIEKHLLANPNANLVLVGDFNDVRDSKPVRTLVGRGRTGLYDVRPLERTSCGEVFDGPRSVAWTYYYGKEDRFERIDYILLSPGMKKELIRKETYVQFIKDWGIASDHRPVMATFEATEN